SYPTLPRHSSSSSLSLHDALPISLKTYELLEAHDRDGQNFLVVGPWNHGGWQAGPGDKLGKIDFGSDTGKHFRSRSCRACRPDRPEEHTSELQSRFDLVCPLLLEK